MKIQVEHVYDYPGRRPTWLGETIIIDTVRSTPVSGPLPPSLNEPGLRPRSTPVLSRYVSADRRPLKGFCGRSGSWCGAETGDASHRRRMIASQDHYLPMHCSTGQQISFDHPRDAVSVSTCSRLAGLCGAGAARDVQCHRVQDEKAQDRALASSSTCGVAPIGQNTSSAASPTSAHSSPKSRIRAPETRTEERSESEPQQR